jgi:uncharacterized delta-60 repeat protein
VNYSYIRFLALVFIPAHILFVLPHTCHTQVLEAWVASYDGPEHLADWFNTLTLDHLGNVYVTGRCGKSYRNDDICTIKYSPDGQVLWTSYYDSPGLWIIDEPKDITVDNFGNVYVTGQSYSHSAGSEIITIKYDSSGVEQWSSSFSGPGEHPDATRAVVVDELGNVYITGSTFSETTHYDYLTIQYNSDGVEQWKALYDGSAHLSDRAYDLEIDQNGDVLITGGSYFEEAGEITEDIITIKYSTDGQEVWSARYSGPDFSDETAIRLKLDNDGNIIVAGHTDIAYNMDVIVVKYNANGQEQWVAQYDGPVSDFDYCSDLAIDDAGNIYITGYHTTETESDFLTIKYDAQGVQRWIATYNGFADVADKANAIDLHPSGDVYVTGSSDAWNVWYNFDYCTIKYNTWGEEQWVIRYNGPLDQSDYALEIAVHDDNSVYVTGYGHFEADCLYDFITIKYEQEVGIGEAEFDQLIPNHCILNPPFPNPFNPTTAINYTLPEACKIKLAVYDVSGRQVATLVDGWRNAGIHDVVFDASHLASGIYLARLETGGTIATQKLILLK